MNDIIDRKQRSWNERLKRYMQENGYTQESFACDLNKKYNTQFTQKTISRWVNLGDSKNGIKRFPDFENMVLVADFFGIDVGYLIGETDEDSFSLEKTCSYMGLNGEAIKAIRGLTHSENVVSYMRKDMRESFNKFLSAEGFPDFFHGLFDLYHISISKSRIEKREFENIDSAIDYMNKLEYARKIGRYELNEALILLINEVYPKPDLSDLSIKE